MQLTQQLLEAEMEATVEEEGGPVRKDTSSVKKKNPKEKTVWITVPSRPRWRTMVLNLEFKP